MTPNSSATDLRINERSLPGSTNESILWLPTYICFVMLLCGGSVSSSFGARIRRTFPVDDVAVDDEL